jgi:serine phosphatase RsbU (regulator of sigma subunit)
MLDLQSGDLLLLITDGFFEWENTEGEQFGLERLGDCVRRNCHLPPEELIARLYDEVVTFSQGTSQQDDLTAVVVKKVLSRATAVPKAA